MKIVFPATVMFLMALICVPTTAITRPTVEVDFFSGEQDLRSGAKILGPSSLSDVTVVTGAGLKLAQAASRYEISGTWRSGIVPASLVSGRVVTATVERASWIRDGEFAAFAPSDKPLALNRSGSSECEETMICSEYDDYYPSCDPDNNRIETGVWYSRGCSSMAPEADSSGSMQVFRAGSLRQYFPVVAGDSFTLDFSADLAELGTGTSGGNDAEFSVVLTHLDSDHGALSWSNPSVTDNMILELKTGRLGRNFVRDIDNDGSLIERRYRVRVADCEPVRLYEAGAAFFYDDVDRDLCDTTDFASGVTPDERSALIKFAALEFRTNFLDDPAHYALVDDIVLDLDSQIEMDILDADSGEMLQSSVVDGGFYVEPIETTTHPRVRVRVSLRGPGWTSPVLSMLKIEDATELTLRAGDRVTACDFGEARLGFNGNIPPKSEWWGCFAADHTECCDFATCPLPRGVKVPCLARDVSGGLMTLCGDPDEFAPSRDCFTYLNDHEFSRWRQAFFEGGTVCAALSKPGGDVSGGVDFTLIDEGEISQDRLGQGVDIGLIPLMIVTHDSNDFHDDAALNLVSDDDHFTLINEFSEWLAARHSSGGELTIPVVEDFQIFVETNLGLKNADWAIAGLDPSAEAQLMGGAGTSVMAGNSDAAVHTSLNPQCALWDSEYIGTVWGSLDPAAYTNFGFNTFTSRFAKACAMEWRPEDFVDQRSILDDAWAGTPYVSEWQDKAFAVGAYSFPHHVYDPWCDIVDGVGRPDSSCLSSTGDTCKILPDDFPDWDRGWGMEAFAKLVARAALTNLSLPAEAIYYFGAFSNEMQSTSLGNPNILACYHTSDTLNGNLFDRDPGGALEIDCSSLVDCDFADCGVGGTDCDPTIYRPNDGGVAMMKIAEVLSVSNPYEISAETVMDQPIPEEDRYHAGLYEIANGDFVLAVWWFRGFEYHLRDNVWVNYLAERSGKSAGDAVIDTGFTEKRVHDLTVEDLLSVHLDPARICDVARISLDGTEDETVSHEISGNSLIIRDQIVGELPMLLHIALSESCL